jgi:hypothetical protein
VSWCGHGWTTGYYLLSTRASLQRNYSAPSSPTIDEGVGDLELDRPLQNNAWASIVDCHARLVFDYRTQSNASP